MAKPEDAPGQQKVVTIVHPTEPDSPKQVTQEEWRDGNSARRAGRRWTPTSRMWSITREAVLARVAGRIHSQRLVVGLSLHWAASMTVPADEKLAFPQSVGVGNLEDWAHGILLRDWFAAMVLNGMIANLGPPFVEDAPWAQVCGDELSSGGCDDGAPEQGMSCPICGTPREVVYGSHGESLCHECWRWVIACFRRWRR